MAGEVGSRVAGLMASSSAIWLIVSCPCSRIAMAAVSLRAVTTVGRPPVPAGASGLEAGAGAFLAEGAFELRECREQVDLQAAGGGARVDRLGQRAERDTALVEVGEQA